MAAPLRLGLATARTLLGPHPCLAAGEKYLRTVPALLPALQPPFGGAGWLTRRDGLLTGATGNVEPHRRGREPGWPGNPHDPARAAATPSNVRTEVP